MKLTSKLTPKTQRKHLCITHSRILHVGVKTLPFKIESDVSAVLVRNRRAKVVNQSFSVEMLGCVGHWGGQP